MNPAGMAGPGVGRMSELHMIVVVLAVRLQQARVRTTFQEVALIFSSIHTLSIIKKKKREKFMVLGSWG